MRSPGKPALAAALALLCLGAAARTVLAAQPAGVSLSLPHGRLAVSSVTDPRSPWVRYDDGRLTRAEGCGPFDGGIDLHDADGCLEICARRNVPAADNVVEVRLVQGRECSLSLTVRAAAPEPPTTGAPAARLAPPAVALTFRAFREADLTRLVLRHPETRPYVDALLVAIEPGCRWEPDAFAIAQLDRAAYAPAAGVAEQVTSALAALRSEDWRQRRRAAETLRSPDLALYCLLRLDRAALSPEQRRGVDEALAAFPVLTEADREALKKVRR